jgi:hypothetical protein
MTTTATTRKPTRETHGTCRLIPACNLPLPEALDAGEAMLTITPARSDLPVSSYTVLRLQDKAGRTLGFRLTRLAEYIVDKKVYDVDVTSSYGWTCDCPDAQFQSRPCKHCRALKAGLTAAGIALSEPKPEEEETIILTEEPPQPVEMDNL